MLYLLRASQVLLHLQLHLSQLETFFQNEVAIFDRICDQEAVAFEFHSLVVLYEVQTLKPRDNFQNSFLKLLL